MPGTQEAKDRFVAGLKEGLTWENVGKELASGLVSGIGSWAIGKLMDHLFATNNSVEELLEGFKNQLLDELPPIIKDIVVDAVEENTLRNNMKIIRDNVDNVLRKFNTDLEAVSTQEIFVCYNSIGNALSQAKSLSRPDSSSEVEIPGFPLFFFILPVYVAVCDAMVYKMPIQQEISIEKHKRRWYGYVETALAEARIYHWASRIWLYEENSKRVEIEQFRGPGERTPGHTWAVMVDQKLKRWLTSEEEMERDNVRLREISLLNGELNNKIIHPAMNIIFEIEEYSAQLLTRINLDASRRAREDRN